MKHLHLRKFLSQCIYKGVKKSLEQEMGTYRETGKNIFYNHICLLNLKTKNYIFLDVQYFLHAIDDFIASSFRKTSTAVHHFDHVQFVSNERERNINIKSPLRSLG